MLPEVATHRVDRIHIARAWHELLPINGGTLGKLVVGSDVALILALPLFAVEFAATWPCAVMERPLNNTVSNIIMAAVKPEVLVRL